MPDVTKPEPLKLTPAQLEIRREQLAHQIEKEIYIAHEKLGGAKLMENFDVEPILEKYSAQMKQLGKSARKCNVTIRCTWTWRPRRFICVVIITC